MIKNEATVNVTQKSQDASTTETEKSIDTGTPIDFINQSVSIDSLDTQPAVEKNKRNIA